MVKSFWGSTFGAGPQKTKKIKRFQFLWGPAPKVPPQNKLTKHYFKIKILIFKMIKKVM